MSNKAKLAFDLLEQEMEVFSREEQRAVFGGYDPSTDCFFRCLGWISAMYGNQDHDANFYSRAYSSYCSWDYPSTGAMEVGEVWNFTGNYFNTANLNQNVPGNLENWINNPSGDNHMIATYRTASGGLHAVAVTSISGGRCYYYDPQNDVKLSRPISDMSSFYGIYGECPP